MVGAGRHGGGRTVYCSPDPEVHAYAVVSRGPNHRQKDMGGLLQEHGRDILVFRAETGDAQALLASKKLSKKVSLVRKVKDTDTAAMPGQYVYIYCRSYEVVEGWQPRAQAWSGWYFKMLRLSGQARLIPLKMQWLRSRPNYARESFPKTWEAYERALHRCCGQPCERVQQHGGGMSADDIAALAEYDLCDICGMDIIEKDMPTCNSCQQAGWKTKACDVCVSWQEKQWIMTDVKGHHWHCSACRSKGMHLSSGYTFPSVPVLQCKTANSQQDLTTQASRSATSANPAQSRASHRGANLAAR